MKLPVAKQLVFDCAMELLYEHEGLSKEQIADKLMYIVRSLDENENKFNKDELVPGFNKRKEQMQQTMEKIEAEVADIEYVNGRLYDSIWGQYVDKFPDDPESSDNKVE